MSVLDVLERYSFGFYEVIRFAGELRNQADLYQSTRQGGSSVSGLRREEFSTFVDRLKAECDALGFGHVGDLAAHAKSRLVERGENYTHTELLNAVDTLIFSFEKELHRELFFRIPRDMERFFEQDALFGPEVAGAFVSAGHDIQKAGTCYALGLDDGCVFHLMRVLELGLNVIAGRVGVDFERKNWGNLIEQIEAALKKSATSGGDAEERKLYSQAATHFHFVKDAWRNEVMHANEMYDTGKALSVLTNVGGFMEALAAAGLSEPS